MQWFDALLLLTVHVDGDFLQTKVVKVKQVARQSAVECVVANESDDHARRQLSGK